MNGNKNRIRKLAYAASMRVRAHLSLAEFPHIASVAGYC